MAVTTDAFTNTDLAAFIKEVWTPLVNEKLFAARSLANFCTDLSPYMSSGGDIAHVPDVYANALTVSTQSTQGAEITTASPAQVDTTLTVSTHKYVAYLIGKLGMRQVATQYDYGQIYARQAGRLLGDALEAALAALWSSLSTNSVGATSAAVSDLNIRQAISKLDALFYPLYGGETRFFFHPTAFWTQVVAIQKYYDQSMRGIGTGQGASWTGGIGSGSPTLSESDQVMGKLYGIDVSVSANIVSALQTYRNLLLHKSCFGFALQTQGPYGGAEIAADYLVQNIGMLTVADIIYGTGILREPAGVNINTSNSATTA